MLKAARSYEEACRTFRWRVPERYNLAFDVCDRQTMAGADGHRTALIVEQPDGGVDRYTFHVLRLLSNRLANVLTARGIGPADRVAVSFGPSVEAVVALLAVVKMGAVAVPLPVTLGEEPLAARLAGSGASAAIVDAAMAPVVLAARQGLPELETILVANEAPGGSDELWTAMERASDSFAPAVTGADEAAFLFYPRDARRGARGILHAHRAFLGSLPSVEFALGFFPQSSDVLWTPADWMSFEGLIWGVLPAWHHGVPVVARSGASGPFDPELALGVMGRHGVRAAWMPVDCLAALTEAAAHQPHPMPRSLATGSDTMSAALHEQVARVFGVVANEVWGVPESGAVAANNGALMEIRPGSPGRAAPGVTVEAVGERGRVLRAGDRGVLAVAPGSPGTFLGYWGEDGSPTLDNGWLATGRLGMRDLDGYLWPEPLALAEGTILVHGLPVRLEEMEAALANHPQVAAAAVVAVADGKGGTEIKAFVVPQAGSAADLALARELQSWTAARRAAHEVPRRVEFVDTLPVTAEGQVAREELAARPIRLDAPASEDRWTVRR